MSPINIIINVKRHAPVINYQKRKTYSESEPKSYIYNNLLLPNAGFKSIIYDYNSTLVHCIFIYRRRPTKDK